MKHHRLYQYVRAFTVFLLLLLFSSQNTLLCAKISDASLDVNTVNGTVIQPEKNACVLEIHKTEVNCSYPCHFNVMSTPSIDQKPVVPQNDSKPLSLFFPKDVIFTIFHPPTIS